MVKGKKSTSNVDRDKAAGGSAVEGSEQLRDLEVEEGVEVKAPTEAPTEAPTTTSAGQPEAAEDASSKNDLPPGYVKLTPEEGDRIFTDAGLTDEQMIQFPELCDMALRGYAWIAGEWRRPEKKDIDPREGVERERLERQRKVAEAYDARNRVHDGQPGGDPPAN